MKEEITVSEYLQAVITVRTFEIRLKRRLTIDEFLDWYQGKQFSPNPGLLVRALTILKTTTDKTRIYSVSGKDLRPFAGFAKSYGRKSFDIHREMFFDEVLERIRGTEGKEETEEEQG